MLRTVEDARAYMLALPKHRNDPTNKEKTVDILVKYFRQDRNDSTDTYDYFVTRRTAPTIFKKMTDGLISLEDMKRPVPPMSEFVDPSFVQEA